jgi:Bor protein
MHHPSRWLLAMLFMVAAGCYHATVETGATPSTEVINNSFASGWIFGLVPPSTVSTAAKCPDGVAKVETQLSFVNQLVSFLTLGIYTPMEIKVTCAAATVGGAVRGPGQEGPSAAPATQADSTAPDSARAMAVPAGTRWVGSISQKMYYGVGCPAAQALPEADRLYFSSDDGPKSAGFRRSSVC